MEPTTISALITAIGTVIGEIIGLLANRNKKKKDKIRKSLHRETALHQATDIPKKTPGGKSKNIYLKSSSVGTIVQSDRIESININNPFTEAEIPDSLKLVDISIEEPDNKYPRIDVKVRNVGNKVCFIKKAEFHFMKTGEIQVCGVRFQASPVTAKYDVGIPRKKPPFTLDVNISQSIQPNDVDRFQFVIGHEFGDVYLSNTLVYFKLILYYNETNEKLVSDAILLSVPMHRNIIAMTKGFPDVEMRKINQQIASAMVKLPGIRSNSIRELEKQLKKM